MIAFVNYLYRFQSLIGTIKTRDDKTIEEIVKNVFQSLIGTIKTREWELDKVPFPIRSFNPL